MYRNLKFSYICLLTFACLAITAYADVPDTITVHGQLLDETGTPLTGDRAYEITFFDAEVDGNPLGTTFTGTTQLSLEGIFDIPLTLPEEAKVVAELWYAIAVDSDAVANGIDANDLFPNRIKVDSVPFALQAATVETIPMLEGVTTPVQEQLDAKANAADVYTQTQIDDDQAVQDAEIALKANATDVYTQTEVDDSQALQDAAIAEKANSVDVYTQTEIDDSQALQDALIAGNLARDGESYVIVEATDNVITNGTNLLAAYALAKTKTPHGLALSATNRVVVIVPPGNYDLVDAIFPLDGEFVDVEGVSSDCTKQYVYGSNHILVQTAQDVRIANLSLYCEDSTYKTYYPGVSWNDGVDHSGSPPETEFNNCRFFVSGSSAAVMRSDVEYAGKYSDCVAGNYAFGGSSGTASGVFSDCTGGARSFGGDGGTTSGTFDNCTGGAWSFGGNAGRASGDFSDCTGGDYAFGGLSGTASGTFTNCIGGVSAFGSYGSADGGTFFHCFGGSNSFIGSGIPAPYHHVCFVNNALYSGND